MILIALFTPKDDPNRLDRFYAKMRTPVSPDPGIDAREMALSMENPHRFADKKLFANSDWEFNKWNRVDALGFLASIGVLLAMIGLMKFLVSLGG